MRRVLTGVAIAAATLSACLDVGGLAVDGAGAADGAPGDGASFDGSAGDAGPGAPVPVEVTVALGDLGSHACARYSDGTVYCWGQNVSGQVGADPATAGGIVNKPVLVPGLGDAIQISAGSEHTCALRADHTVSCWGTNAHLELGVPKSATSTTTPAPIQVQGLPQGVAVRQVSAGYWYTCATLADDRVFCWGDDEFSLGPLGLGPDAGMRAPTNVDAGGQPLLSVRANWMHTCAIGTPLRSVWCWGVNSHGELGRTGTPPIGNLPMVATAPDDTIKLTGGIFHSCSLSAREGVVCWGSNNYGQLGDAAAVDGQASSGTVVGGFGAAATLVDISGGTHDTCALYTDGTVRCVGDNSHGEIGANIDAAIVSAPTAVTGIDDATALAMGKTSGCVVRKGHGPSGGPSVYCWGANDTGQLGNGTSAPAATAVRVLLP